MLEDQCVELGDWHLSFFKGFADDFEHDVFKTGDVMLSSGEHAVEMAGVNPVGDHQFPDPGGVFDLEEAVESEPIFFEGMTSTSLIVGAAIFDVGRIEVKAGDLVVPFFQDEINIVLSHQDEIVVHEGILVLERDFDHAR